MKSVDERRADIRKLMTGMVATWAKHPTHEQGEVRRPGQGVIDSSTIIMQRSTVIVYGDRGDAVYRLTEPATFARVAEYDAHYLASKCRASDTGGGRAWSPDRARDVIREWLEPRHDAGTTSEALEEAEQWDAFADPYHMHAWLEQCGGAYELQVPDEGPAWIGDAITSAVLWHLEAVRFVVASQGGGA